MVIKLFIFQKEVFLGMPNLLSNGKKCICINLKRPEGIQIVEKLCAGTDILLEPYRPGKYNLFIL